MRKMSEKFEKFENAFSKQIPISFSLHVLGCPEKQDPLYFYCLLSMWESSSTFNGNSKQERKKEREPR